MTLAKPGIKPETSCSQVLFGYSKHGTVFCKVEKNVGKGENAGNQHFLIFPTMLSKSIFLQMCEKSILYGKGLMHLVMHKFNHVIT